ncbi:Autophagy-related protein 16 [Rhynchospora pubera]|uniref:Autophagy-related protein 16 n=1 Tax=Rhynchospora pubera TaxID=906938 RepID=A0AAV8FPG1_9POAL|nr:Autophagy-related protein 16 [Rhynchospora pubera]KAJ4795133.1 Autophagy-related protein 16 [Rhynchospora pubera]
MIWEETEKGKVAIKRALKALRKRHLVEEGAHAPAIDALSKPYATQSLEWKEKAEKLEMELQQCYKAQSRLSEQLVVVVDESRSSKTLVQEKEALITELQNNFYQASEENTQLKEELEEKTRAVDLLIAENQSLKSQLEDALAKLRAAETENKSLIDRWMLEKMKDAEKLNEANAMYEEMLLKLRAAGIGGIQQTAQKQADGIIRRTESGYLHFNDSPLSSLCKVTIQAHQGGCGSVAFQHNSDRLISGGQDRTVKIWDPHTGALISSLQGSVGSVLDLAVSNENRLAVAACSSNNLCVWDINGGRLKHTLTGNIDKVCSVDTSRVEAFTAASASLDHTIKIWDLNSGFCINTIMSESNCNSLAFVDRDTVCSGHVNGNLRLWDIRKGKCTSQVAAHTQVTSVCVSRSGNFILTSGKDNVHNLFDIRTLEVCGTFRAGGNQVVTRWGRPCFSPDGNFIAAGSSDGNIHVWSRVRDGAVTVLEGHSSAVLSCAWSERGTPLASADRNGNVYIWT